MDGQAIAFTVQYVELLTSLLGSAPQRSNATLPEDSVHSRAERLRFLAPSPLSSPVAALVTGSDVTCLDVKVPRAPAVPKVPKPEDCSPEATRWPKASNLPKGPTIMLPPGAIKPHSEYQDERLKKRTAYLPRPLELPQANSLLGRLSLL
mmetsp:Transcript_59061/g.93468  ORF Transcript_59061/g.93468 Transcript_59061/m.93468 type:complete len:150 (+) Transcript_59061:37-486(+)